MGEAFPVGVRRPTGRELAGARLAAMADMIPHGAAVADIGSDHGRLPALLLAEGRAAVCIVTETAPRDTLSRLARADRRVRLRLGDGLAVVGPDDGAEVVAIGGMGARAIIRILQRGLGRLGSVRRLVLQPQAEWPLLRAWLRAHGWGQLDERLVRERGRVYLVLAAERGPATGVPFPDWSEADLLEAGPGLLRRGDPLATGLWRQHVTRLERACASAGGARATDAGLARARRILAAFACGSTPPLQQ